MVWISAPVRLDYLQYIIGSETGVLGFGSKPSRKEGEIPIVLQRFSTTTMGLWVGSLWVGVWGFGMEFEELNVAVREFCEVREWGQFHSPKELGIGLVTESSELLDEFRFKDEDEQVAVLEDAEGRAEVEAEVADVLFFLLRFADLYDVDLEEALERKLAVNRERYPVDEYKGRNEKYDE